jgi:signal transduction histidine kinase
LIGAPSCRVRRYLALIALVAVLATGLTGALVYSTRTLAASLNREALLQQRNRAADLASRLDDNLQLSSQIADSTATVVAPLRSRDEIETFLRRMLDSTSPEFVYGIGVWFEPYRLDASTRYYGPYVHRSPHGPLVTFEWSTPQYDYPRHAWYQLGKESGARPAFTEPYFDVDHVYMTTTRSFFDAQGAPLGVISVDLILPQVRELVSRVNITPRETFYVTTREEKVFAHPDGPRLLAWARTQGRTPATLLDLAASDLDAFERSIGEASTREHQELVIPRCGWKVHVSSDRSMLFAESRRIAWFSLPIALLLWAAAIAIVFAHVRRLQATDLAKEVETRARVEQSLRERVRERDEFLSLASHELRTPLTPLLGRLQLMQRLIRTSKPVESMHVERAIVSAQRLQTLIDDLLDVSRMQAGRLAIHAEPTSFSDIVRRCVANVSLSPEHKIDAEIRDHHLEVFGDPSRLEQVVTNLLSNAVKYSPAGGTVRVSLSRRANDAVLVVRDQGIGIPRQDLARVFERYFRASNAPATSYPGLGLGLFLCRDIVTRHGGTISVDSEPGRGTTVTVAMPLLESSPKERTGRRSHPSFA